MTLPIRRNRGFSLIELMITLAMFAILVAIAVPSYAIYKRKAHRAVARTVLTELVAKQEAVSLRTGSYANSFEPLYGHPGTTVYLRAQGQIDDALAATSVYKLDLVDGGTNNFSFAATAVNGQAKDVDCIVMSLKHNGQRLPADDNCWPL